ncbi:hypothetical protein KS18_24520 [Photorhabdus luminescens]|nr:hypothetical protein KS18_24520 [Photorhabdus luminescens]
MVSVAGFIGHGFQAGQPVVAKGQGRAIRAGETAEPVKGVIGIAGGPAFPVGDCRDPALAVVVNRLPDAIR